MTPALHDTLPANDALLDRARQLIQQGKIDEAEQAYAHVLKSLPNEVEALNFVAMRALARDQKSDAIALLEHAANTQPNHAVTLRNLGVAYDSAGQFEAAAYVLQRAVKNAPDFFVARLQSAGILEKLGHEREALTNYFAAITTAQKKGRWLNDATTAPFLRDQVKHAMQYVHEGRERLFFGALAPLREQYGDDALKRVRKCLDIYLGNILPSYTDSHQRPKFLYFPDLPTTAYFDRELFSWAAELELHTTVIREELLAMLASEQGFEPFLKLPSNAEADQYLRGTRGKPTWDGFFFYRHGMRHEDNCRRCPRTAGILDNLPLVRIREHAPEILFSVLTPGSHILPHYGVTNTRIVMHLPLIIPEDCAIKVGGEIHAWQEGRCVMFDDTFEHEAWNRSSQTRVILLMDAWNPYLTEVECLAVTELVGAIGDFNKESGLHAEQ